MSGEAKPPLDPTLPAATPKPVAVPLDPAGLPVVDAATYQVLSELGRGGLGRILRARDKRTGRVVAIKEVLPGLSGADARFVREALVTANLQHPAIVPVYEVGRWPTGQPFYAMKLVTGRPLEQVMEEAKGRPSRLALLPHLVAVTDALAYAHEERVIHRDLKPANVLVGDFGETVVIDWGLAKRLDDAAEALLPQVEGAISGDLTHDGALVGTPRYMAPEQAAAREADTRTDVYALGLILHELLSGRPPHDEAGSVPEVLMRIAEAALPPLDDPTLPEDLRAIVAKATAHAPGDRYPSARELADDLHRFSTGQLVSAHRYSLGDLAKRFLRRHRAAVTVAAFAAVALIAGGTFAVTQVIGERDRALVARAEADDRLTRLYTARGVAELGADRPLRALPILLEAFRRDEATVRPLIGRAIEPLAHERAGLEVAEITHHAVLPGTGHIVAGTGDGDLLRFDPETSTVVWRVRHGEGPVNLEVPAGGELVAAYAGRLLVVSAADGRALAELQRPGLAPAVPPAPSKRTPSLELPSLATSKDGKLLAVAHKGGLLDAWDLSGRRWLWAVPIAAQGRTLAITEKGRIVACGERLEILDTAGRGLHAVAEPCQRTSTLGHGERLLAQIVHPRLSVNYTRVIDAETGKVVADLGLSVHAAASDDGQLVALLMPEGGAVTLWSLAEGQAIRSIPVPGQLMLASFSPDGARLVVSNFEGATWLLETASGLPLARFDAAPFENELFSFTPDGRRMTMNGSYGKLRVWDLSALPLRSISETTRTWNLAASPDGRFLAAGLADGRVLLRDVETGAVVRRLGPHQSVVGSLEFSKDGALLVTGSRDQTAALWDVASGALRQRFTGHQGSVRRAVLTPDGATLVTASVDHTVRRWDARSGRLIGTLVEHPTELMSVRLSPDGRQAASLDVDGTVYVTELESGRRLGEIQCSFPGIDLAFSPDGRTLAVGASRCAALYRLDGSVAVKLESRTQVNDVLHVAFDATGDRLAGGSSMAEAYVWDTGTGKLLMATSARSSATRVGFSRDGGLMAFGSLDEMVRIVDLGTGQLVASRNVGGEVYTLLFTPDGESLAIATDVEAAALWHIPPYRGTGDELARLIRCRVPWALDVRGVLVPSEPDPTACSR